MMKTKQAMFFKKSALAGLISAAFAASLPVHAGVTFDPDGPGGIDPAIDLGNLDWGPTSFLAQNGNQAIRNFDPTAPGGGACKPGLDCTFTVYVQANLSATRNQSNVANTPAHLNQPGANGYEITLMASFTEQVTGFVGLPGAAGSVALFNSVPSSPAIAQIFYDPARNANQLEGSGFNDGTLILSATQPITSSNGIFSVNGGGPGTNLDQTGNGNQYTGQSTTTGIGNTSPIAIDNISQDLNFFQTKLAPFGLSFLDIGQTLPFQGVDPMDCFDLAPYGGAIGTISLGGPCVPGNHVNGTYAANAGQPGYTPVVGAVNGNAGDPASVDFVAATDFNSPIAAAAAPEPTSLALLGLGLGALSFAGSRRRRPA